jgi:hypothetical protein
MRAKKCLIRKIAQNHQRKKDMHQLSFSRKDLLPIISVGFINETTSAVINLIDQTGVQCTDQNVKTRDAYDLREVKVSTSAIPETGMSSPCDEGAS